MSGEMFEPSSCRVESQPSRAIWERFLRQAFQSCGSSARLGTGRFCSMQISSENNNNNGSLNAHTQPNNYDFYYIMFEPLLKLYVGRNPKCRRKFDSSLKEERRLSLRDSGQSSFKIKGVVNSRCFRQHPAWPPHHFSALRFRAVMCTAQQMLPETSQLGIESVVC